MERTKPKATIGDVARAASVAPSTVSRVVNGLNRVSPATRARIQAAISVLGFQPNALARGLALQRTFTIGLIVPNITDPFFSAMVRGVEETATAAGYSLVIASQPRRSAQHRYHQLFTQGRVDGLVLVAIDVGRRELDELRREGFPVAVIQEDLGGHVPAFITDNYGGAQALAAHLVAHGYRRIAYISGSDYTPDSRDRLRALRDVLREHDAALPDTYVIPGDYLPERGYAGLARLLDLHPRPEAIFAANDQMAAAAIRAATDYGLSVPADLAIVGFDDIALARYTTPRLTTVRQPAYEMGQRALQTVIAPSAEAAVPGCRVLPTTLVVRESCGCPGPARIPSPDVESTDRL